MALDTALAPTLVFTTARAPAEARSSNASGSKREAVKVEEVWVMYFHNFLVEVKEDLITVVMT